MAAIAAMKVGVTHMGLLKRRLFDALALAMVALMGISTVGVLEAVAVDAQPVGPRAIGTPDAYGPQTANPPMGDGCGTDIVLLVDERDDAAPDTSNALRKATEAFLAGLDGTGSRVAVVPFADRARLAGTDFQHPATSAFKTPGSGTPLRQDPSGGSNWESAFMAAIDRRAVSGEGTDVVTVLLVSGPPNRHLIGADNELLATSAPLGIHMLEAVTAANTLKADTRVIAVGVGAAAEFGAELAAVSGHIWSNTTMATTDPRIDVHLVPEPDDAAGVMAGLASDFCSLSTTLRMTTADTGGALPPGVGVGHTAIAIDRIPTTQPTPSADASELLAVASEATTGGSPQTDPETPASETATDETVTKEVVTKEVVTDKAGMATMNIRLVGPTDLVIRPNVPSGHVAGSCLVNGRPTAVTAQGGQITVPAVTNGDDVSCRLRVLNPDEPLVVTHRSAPGNIACHDTTAVDDSFVLSAIGEDVTHCIEVINAGDQTLDNLSIGSDVTTDASWADTTTLEPGESVLRRVVTTLDRAGDVITRATALHSRRGVLDAMDIAALETLPPALTVARGLLTGDGACDLDAPLTTAVGAIVPLCYEVTNTGGTALADVTVIDDATDSPRARLGTAALLAPGETTTIRTAARLARAGDSAVATVTALPADLNGNPVAGAVVASADTSADGPVMRVDHRASDRSVASGEHVEFTVTVSNPGPVSLADIVVGTSACADDLGAANKLVDDDDDTLDPGEAWLYRCTEPIGHDLEAVATATASGDGEPLLSTATARVKARRVDLTINKKSDQRLRFGDIIEYRIESYSFGPDTVDNAKIIDELPAGLNYVNATVGRGSCSNSGRTVTCDIGRFEPLERIQVLICTRISDASWVGKVISNTARVTASSPTDRIDNTDSHIDRVQDSSVTTTTRRLTTLPPEDQKMVLAPPCNRGSSTPTPTTTQRTTTTATTTTTTPPPAPTTTLKRDPTTTRQTTTTLEPDPTTTRQTTTTDGPPTSEDRQAGASANLIVTTSSIPSVDTTRRSVEDQRPAPIPTVAPPPRSGPGVAMASTGVNSDALATNAFVFLAAGLAFTGLARRRRLLF